MRLQRVTFAIMLCCALALGGCSQPNASQPASTPLRSPGQTTAPALTPEIRSTAIPAYDATQERTFPSICRAWSDNENRPDLDAEQRMALYDLAFLSMNDLNLKWRRTPEHPYPGYATSLVDIADDSSLAAARAKVQRIRALNPHIRLLVEVRYHDAEYVAEAASEVWWDAGYYPAASANWLRDEQGRPIPGYGEDSNRNGMLEPDEIDLMKIDFRRSEVQDHVVQQALALRQTGLIDGIMLDWWLEDASTTVSPFQREIAYMTLAEELDARLTLLAALRAAVGEDFLILVNSSYSITPASAPYVNGLYMELWRADPAQGYSLDELQRAEQTLAWAETHLRQPTINCIEGWRVVYDYGNQAAQIEERDSAENQRWMRLFTTLALTHSSGYVLFSDHNAEPTSDHLHNWYSFWDAPLGIPVSSANMLYNDIPGLFIREFSNGFAVYNRSGAARSLAFNASVLRVSTGDSGRAFVLPNLDGEFFLNQ